ncbi:alcohol dehydrogenase catalytic domain-containing protein [Leucobacter sp. Z1108]|uniref:alcohol dehydrogenase catalytic domain-containing protein n=1 Tax=Leucobacter sp. Z1108 TaxID=3439066 RepID=UPI003F3B0B75
MRAAVVHAAEDLRNEEVPEPKVAPNEVKIRNAFCGICGSDIAMFFNPSSIGIDYSQPHPVTGTSLPQIIGHEFSGTVVAVGSEVENFTVGDNVVAFPMIHCGECSACKAGLFRICKKLGTHGFTSKSGGLADYSALPADKLFRLPEGIPLKLGALVEPLAVSWHAVRRSGIAPGQRALIIGGGPIGIGVALALRAFGIEDVRLSETSATRRKVIEAMGIASLADTADLKSQGEIDIVFDAAGHASALDQAIEILKPQGIAVIVAIYKRPMQLTGATIALKELRIIGSLAYEAPDFAEVIAAMTAGLIDTGHWVEVGDFDELEQTIRALARGERLKVLVDMRAGSAK